MKTRQRCTATEEHPMTRILTADEAIIRATWTHTVRLGTEQPITDNAGTTIGWTFRAQIAGASHEYGWVLADGRVSHNTEWTRADAADCARRTVRAV